MECLLLILSALVVLNSNICCATATALDEYVAKPDSNFRWYDTGERINGVWWKGVVLNMTSQRWMSAQQVSCSLWSHHLVIVTPKIVLHKKTAILAIAGGNNLNFSPSIKDRELLLAGSIASRTNSLAMVVYQVPNQPCNFRDDPAGRRRSEDHLIAYTWFNFLKQSRSVEWPAQLPMTKSVVRAMDVLQQYVAKRLKMEIKYFVSAGASKRGWITWTTAAVDRRIVGFIPIVMDCLSMQRNFHHFFQSLGGWPYTFKPYFELNITSVLDSVEFKKLMVIIDPYNYIVRLHMPKLMITASNDEFFLLDDSAYFWNDIKGEKHILILPNTEHSLITSFPKIVKAISSFYLSITMEYEKKSTVSQHVIDSYHLQPCLQRSKSVNDNSIIMRPRYSVEINRNAGKLMIKAMDRPLKATLWYAHTLSSNRRRDFRWFSCDLDNCQTLVFQEACFQPIFFHMKRLHSLEPVTNGSVDYHATIPVPRVGYGAFFVELRFQGPTYLMPFIVSTEAVVVPNNFPFKDCYGAQCMGTLV